MVEQTFAMRVLGTQTAGVSTAGGAFPAPTYNDTDTELYDGSAVLLREILFQL